MSVLEELRKLDEQRTKLIEGARSAALEKANAAIAELAELGYHYKLVEGTGATRTATPSTGGRRTGVKEQVLQIIKQSTGMTRQDVLEAMGAKEDKSATASVDNALSNLKKAGSLTLNSGTYTAA